MRKSVVLVGLLGLGLVSFVGCTSILGDFEVRPGSGGGGDGGPDVGTSDGPAGGDGSVDGPPGPRELKCTFNAGRKREIKRSLTPGEVYDRPLQVFRVGQNGVRVTVPRRGGTGAGGVEVLTFDPDSGGPTQALNTPCDGPYLGARRMANGIGMMVGNQPGVGATTWNFGVAVAPDTNFQDLISPTFDVVQNIPQAGPGSRTKGSWIELGPNDYYFAMSYTNPSSSRQNSIAGRARGSTATPGAFGAFDLPDMLSLVFENSSMFYLVGGDPGTATSGEIWRLPDNGTVPGNVPGHRISVADKLDLLLGGTRSSVDTSKINMAVLEIGQGAAAPDLKVGQVAPFSLETVDATALSKTYTFGALDELPVDKGGFGWTGDDWLMIGGPGPDTAPSFRGLNFLWADATGHVRGKIVGQANAILQDVQNQLVAAAVTKRPGGLDLFANVDIVWIEQQGSGSSAISIIYYSQISCVP